MTPDKPLRAILARGQTAHDHVPGFPAEDSPCILSKQLLPLPYGCFNPTCAAHPDGLRLYYRRSRVGSDLFFGRYSYRHDTLSDRRLLDIDHPHALAARADPRFFEFMGKPHLAVSGVQQMGDDVSVHQLVAELSADGRSVKEVWEPDFVFRQTWEKNWQFFSFDGELFAVYRVVPHIIVRIVHRVVSPYARHDWAPAWVGGHMRGGASPVLHDGQWWCFFHGRLDHDGWPYVTYSMGCYTFDVLPPFRPIRYTPRPILIPPVEGWPREMGISVVYPGGAVRLADRWQVVYGIHDSFCGLCEIDPKALEKEMVAA